MKHLRLSKLGKASLIVIVLFVLAGTALAASGVEITRHVIGGGGGHAAAGRYGIDATIGQAVAGTVDTTVTELCAGFWCGLGEYKVYLPVVLRS